MKGFFSFETVLKIENMIVFEGYIDKMVLCNFDLLFFHTKKTIVRLIVFV